MFVQFAPNVVGGKDSAGTTGLWSANKLGQWIDTSEAVSGGSKHLEGVTEAGVKYDAGGGASLAVAATDIAVATFGGPLTGYPVPVTGTPDTDGYGTSFVLWDNLWGTNYVMWWPFAAPNATYADSLEWFPS